MIKTLKSLVAICMLCTTIAPAWAQSGFGIRAGLNVANQSIKNDGITIRQDSKLGFDAAILYNAAFPGGFAIQPEIHFAQAGFKINASQFGQGEAELNYIQVPILFKFDVLASNELLALSPFVGPYVAVGVSGKQGDFDIEFDGDYKRLDYGAIAGVMMRFTPGFFFDIRYNFGLANVSDASSASDITVKNEILGLGVGFIF